MKHAPLPVIRLANTGDAALLAELGARTFSETFAVDNTAEDMAAYLAASFGTEQQKSELADPEALFLIGEVEGVAAGYAKLKSGDAPDGVTDQRPIELVRLYALQQWLGRGVGAALMQSCIDHARQRGRQTLWLGVWENNQRARAFYRKWQFREVGTHIFQLGQDAQTDILMERDL
jgi:ribosomal protein S18 acetylase RimI-like enzyme